MYSFLSKEKKELALRMPVACMKVPTIAIVLSALFTILLLFSLMVAVVLTVAIIEHLVKIVLNNKVCVEVLGITPL